MKPPKLDKHYKSFARIKAKLESMTCPPFEQAAKIADSVVQKWLADHGSQFDKKSDAGGTFNWSQERWEVVDDHCVRYVMFHHAKVRTLIGLGYDLRHWVLDGSVEKIPWRLWFDTKEIPKNVRDKLQHEKRGKQDAFAYTGNYPFFVPVPEKYLKGLERLPFKDEDKYVKKLADAVFAFLNDLYT